MLDKIGKFDIMVFMAEQKREYYLDWLRIVVVALLVPHHIAITFSHIGDAYVFLPIKDNSLYFFIQSTFLNLWFMRLLFFVSGISTYYALQKRTNREYITERCKKLLLPTIFAIIFICPIMAYFRAININNFQGSIIQFFPIFFTKFETYLGWAHFWFLIYLFVYSLVFLALKVVLKNNIQIIEKTGSFLAKGKNIILPLFIITFFEIVFRPFYPGLQNLVDDWANFTVYLSFFILGYVMTNSAECLEKIEKNIHLFFIVACITVPCTIFLKYAQNNIDIFMNYYDLLEYAYKVVVAFFQGIAEYSLVMLIIGVAKKYINVNNSVYKYLSKTSFSLYMFHYVIVNMVMYLFIKTQLNHYVMYVLAISSVYIIFIIIFEIFLKRIFIFRFICGIK
jgi:peptidoglycan/LPS O-acetylase OafA/YrhL